VVREGYFLASCISQFSKINCRFKAITSLK